MSVPSLARFKQCNGCGCLKPATTQFFHKSGKGSGKWYQYCKPCRKLYRGFKPLAKWYNPPREWWVHKYEVDLLTQDELGSILGCGRHTINKMLTHHGIVIRPQTMRLWREAIPEEKRCKGCSALKFTSEYYEGVNYCKACVTKRVARYQKANRHKVRAWVHKRLALMRGSYGNVSADVIWQMYEDQSGLCAYCEVPLFGTYHIDHMIPLCNGGIHEWHNIAITCPDCNQRKNRRPLEEFITWL